MSIIKRTPNTCYASSASNAVFICFVDILKRFAAF